MTSAIPGGATAQQPPAATPPAATPPAPQRPAATPAATPAAAERPVEPAAILVRTIGVGAQGSGPDAVSLRPDPDALGTAAAANRVLTLPAAGLGGGIRLVMATLVEPGAAFGDPATLVVAWLPVGVPATPAPAVPPTPASAPMPAATPSHPAAVPAGGVGANGGRGVAIPRRTSTEHPSHEAPADSETTPAGGSQRSVTGLTGPLRVPWAEGGRPAFSRRRLVGLLVRSTAREGWPSGLWPAS